MTDSHGTSTYTYDALDRLTTVAEPEGTVGYAYDAVGNRKSLNYPDGKVANYSYDAANRMAGVTDWLGRTTGYQYDLANNLLSISYPNQAGLSFAYDAASRLIRIANSYRNSTKDDPSPITSFTYLLDAVGNRVQVINGSGKVTKYTYDPIYELTSVQSQADEENGKEKDTKITNFTYDPVGNRLSLAAPGRSISYSYDADDRLLLAGATTFAYDKNGNQIMKTTGSTSVSYAYDATNRLIAANGGGTNTIFTYDGDGNRVSQSLYTYVNDVATALPVVLQETGPDGMISYDHGLGLISESSAAFDFFYQYDGLGSVVGLTDPKDKLVGRYSYDAWGNATPATHDNSIGTENKFRFTGEALDPGTGLYYLRARYYDSSLGRFRTKDPFAGNPFAPKSLNRYIYALNNPPRVLDHTGMAPESCCSEGLLGNLTNAGSTVGFVTTTSPPSNLTSTTPNTLSVSAQQLTSPGNAASTPSIVKPGPPSPPIITGQQILDYAQYAAPEYVEPVKAVLNVTVGLEAAGTIVAVVSNGGVILAGVGFFVLWIDYANQASCFEHPQPC